MKAKEAMSVLGVSRKSLHNYLKTGRIKAIRKANGRYKYDAESIYEFLGEREPNPKKTVIYARVSNPPRKYLTEQEERLLNFCTTKGLSVNEIYSDIKSGINFDRRGLNRLMADLLKGSIGTIVVENKDRLARFGFPLFESICAFYNTQIIVANEASKQNFEQELTEDLISIIHYFSMKSYSNRRKLNKLKKDLQNENP